MSNPPESDQRAAAVREFQPVEGAEEQLKLLREGAKTLASCMIWTTNQEQVINSHLTLFSETDKILYAWVPKDLDPKKFMDDLAKAGSSECFFSLSLSRANIFFKTPYLGTDSGGLRFRAPEKLYKVQRRKDMRYTIPDTHVLKLSYQDPIFPETQLTKRVIDISASGLAILVANEEESFYHPGMVIQNLSLTLKSREVPIGSAEIRHMRALPASRLLEGVKIGLQFRDIKPAEAQWIASYVFEESRKMFSRFM